MDNKNKRILAKGVNFILDEGFNEILFADLVTYSNSDMQTLDLALKEWASKGWVEILKNPYQCQKNDICIKVNRFVEQSLFQLPPERTARYRIEIAASSVTDDMRIPYGVDDELPFLGVATRDFPERGYGGATQVIIQKQKPVLQIFDLETQTYVTVP